MELPIFNILQIYFDAQSKGNCSNHPYVKPIDNSNASDSQRKWFENAVISESLPFGGVYFGVWSHKAERKIQLAGNKHFSFDQLEHRLPNTDKDVIAFHHNCSKLPIFHNKEGVKLANMTNILMEAMEYKYRVGSRVKCAIMQNHFLMKTELYKFYVQELNKAMSLIGECLEPMASERSPYKSKSPINYTYHTFILERFASAFVKQYNPSFTYYKDLT